MNKKTLFLGITLASAILAFAGQPTTAKPVKPKGPVKVILKEPVRDTAVRPKAPSRQVVTCEYDGTYLTFGFVVPEGVCEATVTENFSGASQTYTFDSTPLTADIYVGELYESTVTMTTASGNTYTGSLTADPE